MKALIPYRTSLDVILIVLAVGLITTILLQARGAGLGSVFGGSGTVFKTRRGIEKTLFNTTIIFAILFAVISFLTWLIPAK